MGRWTSWTWSYSISEPFYMYVGKCTLKEHGVFLSQVINLGCLCSLANTGETIAVCRNQGLWHTCCALEFAA